MIIYQNTLPLIYYFAMIHTVAIISWHYQYRRVHPNIAIMFKKLHKIGYLIEFSVFVQLNSICRRDLMHVSAIILRRIHNNITTILSSEDILRAIKRNERIYICMKISAWSLVDFSDEIWSKHLKEWTRLVMLSTASCELIIIIRETISCF